MKLDAKALTQTSENEWNCSMLLLCIVLGHSNRPCSKEGCHEGLYNAGARKGVSF